MPTSNSGEQPAAAAAQPPTQMELDLSSCSECGRDVPAANLVLHEANCRRIRTNQRRPPSQSLPGLTPSLQQAQHPHQKAPPQIIPAPAALEQEPLLQPEPESSRTLERGQTTLDRWLSTARSSRCDRGGAACNVSNRASANSATSSSGPVASALISGNAGSSHNSGTSSNYNAVNDNSADTPSSLSDGNVTSSISDSSTSPVSNSTASSGAANTVADGGASTPAIESITSSNPGTSDSTSVASGTTRNNAPYSSHAYNGSTWAPLALAGRFVSHQEGIDSTIDEGWTNVTYNPQFRRGPNGITRVQPDISFLGTLQNSIQTHLPLNPLVHGGPFATFARIVNGLINGAIVGFTLFDMGGLIIGAFLGATGGIIVDRSRSAEDEEEERTTREVADMLATDDGGIAVSTVRVHRGSEHITALASDSHGRNRVIRVRYGDRPGDRRLRHQYGLGPLPPQSGINTNNIAAGTNNSNINNAAAENAVLRRQVRSAREDLERSLLGILVQMSYSRDFGPGPGNNFILLPEESFEELVHRFGLGGGDNRGASMAVINSYPVEVVKRERVAEREEGVSKSGDENSSEVSEEDSPNGSCETDVTGGGSKSDCNNDDSSSGSSDSTSDMGTCGICLDDYKEGDLIKRLGCPTHPHCFHQGCIDKWLELQACCPICKHRVGMYNGLAPTISQNVQDDDGVE
mmetsp:Transcript_25964/g.56046  ORF Transcript_25964/g.56046 Transcript_25964/m.56046 type:complete len:691 (+) Transcript_25964:49-2121(+)